MFEMVVSSATSENLFRRKSFVVTCPRPCPRRGTGADLRPALSRNGFVAVSAIARIPEFGRFLPAWAGGLRVASRPCSPKNLPRRSRDLRVHPRTGLDG